MASSKVQTWQATFTHLKETKNTHRYEEVGDPEKHVAGSFYLRKAALPKGVEAPKQLKLTVESA